MSESSLLDKVREVVAKLSDKWIVKANDSRFDNDNWVTADNCDGRQLHFRRGGKGIAPRVEISGAWPCSKSNGVITPSSYAEEERGTSSISVGLNRSADVIAAEIERRLLPDYNRVFAICKARAEHWDENDKRRNEAAAELRKLVGDVKSYPGRDPKYVSAFGLDIHSIEVRGPDCIHFDMDISLEAAKAVIEVLKAHPRSND